MYGMEPNYTYNAHTLDMFIKGLLLDKPHENWTQYLGNSKFQWSDGRVVTITPSPLKNQYILSFDDGTGSVSVNHSAVAYLLEK